MFRDSIGCDSPLLKATPKIRHTNEKKRCRPRKVFEPRLSVVEMQAQLVAFVSDYSQSWLPPLEPPPYGFSSPTDFHALLQLWWRRSIETAEEGDAVALIKPEDLVEMASPPSISNMLFIKHVLSHIATSECLQFPWFHIKVILSVQLIRRLTTRFKEYVETSYLKDLDSEVKLLDLTHKGTICGLRDPEKPTIASVYKRDVQAFLEYRQLLPLLLRSYNFPPFTLPRLCELIIEQSPASTWSHNFWKWAHAVYRNLKGVVSSAAQDPDVLSTCPKVSKEISRRVRKKSFLQDTPKSFVRLSLAGGIHLTGSPLLTFKTPCQSPSRAFSSPLLNDSKKRSSHEWLSRESVDPARKRRNFSANSNKMLATDYPYDETFLGNEGDLSREKREESPNETQEDSPNGTQKDSPNDARDSSSEARDSPCGTRESPREPRADSPGEMQSDLPRETAASPELISPPRPAANSNAATVLSPPPPLDLQIVFSQPAVVEDEEEEHSEGRHFAEAISQMAKELEWMETETGNNVRPVAKEREETVNSVTRMAKEIAETGNNVAEGAKTGTSELTCATAQDDDMFAF